MTFALTERVGRPLLAAAGVGAVATPVAVGITKLGEADGHARIKRGDTAIHSSDGLFAAGAVTIGAGLLGGFFGSMVSDIHFNSRAGIIASVLGGAALIGGGIGGAVSGVHRSDAIYDNRPRSAS